MDIVLCSPADLSRVEFSDAVALIAEGGAVADEFVTKWFSRSLHVAIAQENRTIVGVGVIKSRRPNYAREIAGKSDFYFDANTPEIGYISVKEACRGKGISQAIVAELVSTFLGGDLFATTSNIAMKTVFLKNGFVPHGKEWGTPASPLSLWLNNSNNSTQSHFL